MSAQEFMEMLFRKLPAAELRNLCSEPSTPKKLREDLAGASLGHEQLTEMQKIIEAEKSDLFDVLAHDIKRPDLSELLRDNFERYRWKS